MTRLSLKTGLMKMFHSTRVSPLQDEDNISDNRQNDFQRPNSMPQRIPTISENISARKQKNQRHNSIFEMKTL